jgi:hypothetical protein
LIWPLKGNCGSTLSIHKKYFYSLRDAMVFTLRKNYITHVLHLCSVLIRVFFSVLSMVVLIGVLKISWREGACLELGSPDDLGWKLLSVFLEVCFPCYPLYQFS